MRQPRLKATNPGCLNNVTLHTSLLILPDFLFLFRHVLPRFPSLFAFISDTDDTALFFFFLSSFCDGSPIPCSASIMC